ncbi:MAG: DUF983 domain-containing protein [Schleiferiaceae bacterium]|jgi:uncharacterized protein (DUF983 family)
MKLIGKGSKPYSILTAKCPKCHEGEMFVDPNPYRLRNMDQMHASCSVCGQEYEPEPNFYYGAMYVSYAYTVALFVAVYIVCGVWIGLGMWTTVGILAGTLVALGPWLFRLARVTYLNFFVSYDPKAKD